MWHVSGRGDLCTGWGNLMERDPWGDPGVDGKIMLGWIFKKWDVGVRTGLAQDRDRWRAFVSALRKLRVP
jgi:hypothetical protein